MLDYLFIMTRKGNVLYTKLLSNKISLPNKARREELRDFCVARCEDIESRIIARMNAKDNYQVYSVLTENQLIIGGLTAHQKPSDFIIWDIIKEIDELFRGIKPDKTEIKKLEKNIEQILAEKNKDTEMIQQVNLKIKMVEDRVINMKKKTEQNINQAMQINSELEKAKQEVLEMKENGKVIKSEMAWRNKKMLFFIIGLLLLMGGGILLFFLNFIL